MRIKKLFCPLHALASLFRIFAALHCLTLSLPFLCVLRTYRAPCHAIRLPAQYICIFFLQSTATLLHRGQIARKLIAGTNALATPNGNKIMQKSANKPAKAKTETSAIAIAANVQAAAPIANAPKPADVILSARAAHNAAATDARNAGAIHNTRDHNKLAIGVGVAKYAAKHAPNAAYAARVSSLPADTQTYFASRIKAYAGKPFVALSNDNAKLARCINSGLIAIVSGAHKYTDANGVSRIGADSGKPLMLQCILPDALKPSVKA